jgi:hypothetical protein
METWIGTPYGTPNVIGDPSAGVKGPGGKVDCSHLLSYALYELGYRRDYLYTQALWSRGGLRALSSPYQAFSYELPMLITRYGQFFGKSFRWRNLFDEPTQTHYNAVTQKEVLFTLGHAGSLQAALAKGKLEDSILVQILREASSIANLIYAIMSEEVLDAEEIITDLLVSFGVGAAEIALSRGLLAKDVFISLAVDIAAAAVQFNKYFRDTNPTGGVEEEPVGHVLFFDVRNDRTIEATANDIDTGDSFSSGCQGWFPWSLRQQQLFTGAKEKTVKLKVSSWLDSVSNGLDIYVPTANDWNVGLRGRWFALDTRAIARVV